MPIIRRLPEGLVNQIAAGEVVERPASVVKELCENSIDAGASHVQVELLAGGTRLVQVADDGRGMDPEDARLCLERHATSKLEDEAGLSAIASFGFRGEALPAIASVSRFTLTTRPAGAFSATRVKVDGVAPPVVEEAGAPPGTRIEVHDLFFNTPARRKFLKKPPTEGSHCAEAVARLALSHPEVGFSLVADGRRLFGSQPGAPLEERVALALGREVHDHLVAVELVRGAIQVHGRCASPDYSAATAQKIQLFVNGRAIRDRSLSHAVSRAYANLLPPGRYPAAVLMIHLPLEEVDVNVHPQKLEVRFADPRAVYEAVAHAVAEALRPAPWLGGGTQPAPAALRAPPFPPGAPPFALSEVEAHPTAPSTVPARYDAAAWAAGAPLAGAAPLRETVPAFEPAPAGPFASLRVLGQLASTYLVCEGRGGALVVLDQHAAHERVLFEGLRKGYRARALASQRLLLPEVVELPLEQAEALAVHGERIAALGFEAEPFGGRSWSVAAVPALLGRAPPARLFADLAEQLVALGSGDAAEDALNDVLATMACHSAVRAHDPLSHDELRALLRSLDAIDFKVRCPHGRPVVTEIPLAELERRVERR
ncbi:MAG: DNA mismatch repair endonuclease MutL [Myxococcales bacterium]